MSTSTSTSMSRREADHPERIHQQRTVTPAVDIYENADELLLIADVPGVAKDGVTARVDKMELTIEGKRSDSTEGSRMSAEGPEFDYRRTFLLPHGIDADKIVAEMNQGVLRIHLPKSEKLKPRQIQVKASE